MKDSGGNMAKMGDIKTMAKPSFQLFAGSVGFLLPAFTMGAIGGILALANIPPEKCINVYNDYFSGNIEEAHKTQLELIPINTAINSKLGVPALKAAMDYVGLFGGIAMKPMQPINKEIKQQIINLIEKHITIRHLTFYYESTKIINDSRSC